MTTPAFTWTDRARPVIEIGVGDVRIDQDAAQWDVHHWDEPTARWSGIEPVWQEVTCDAFSFRCEYGRQRTTDRFVVGAATVVVWNATGWADPNVTDDPARLTMRPGRSIRVGILHVVLGLRWLYRGFIDSMTPTYDPVQPDTVELSCIDALGEVNRAKVLPVDPPVGAGESVTARIDRLLTAASWPVDKRALASASDTLIADDLGGQLADLLGQAADSGGGNVYGDLDGNVAYKGRDWQIWVPGTPPDATIGNVEPGHLIPGTPEIDAYMAADGVRTISTPDAADLVIAGDVRFEARIRDDSVETTTTRVIAAKQTATGTALDYRFGHTYANAINLTGYPTGVSTLQVIVGAAQRSALGLTPPGVDRYVGVAATGVAPGSQALTCRAQWLTSVDGLAWTPVGSLSAAVRGDALSYDGATPLNIGFIMQGRVYWAQVEAINRARLVFPGILFNALTIPDAPNLNITGDIQVVARVQRPLATAPTTGRVVSKDTGTATGNRGWAVPFTNAGLIGFAMLPSGSILASAAVGFAAGAMGWIRITRTSSTGVCVLEWAPDSPTEPTTGWTVLPQTGAPTPGAIPVTTGTVRIGDRATQPQSPLEPFAGRIARVIIRDGSTTVLDANENNAGKMVTPTTFVATSGQTVTVLDTSSSGYLVGGLGNVNTPDPGVLPATFTIVARANYGTDTTGFPTNAAQNTGVDPRSYVIYRTPLTNGRWYMEVSTDGVWTTRQSRFVVGPIPPQNTDVTLACTFETNVGGRFYMTPWTFSDTTGVWSPGTRTDVGAALTPFDVTTILQIQGWAVTTKLMWNEVRTGTDPNAGSVVWRFDANERTGTGLTYDDPRGRTWTLTAAGAIAPRSPAPIVQPQPDSVVWRFDANDYPGTGLSYVDPRGRTWTLSAAGAIVPKVPAVPDVWIPADVCPVKWERPFARADLATRVIVGRDSETAQVLDDPAGQLLYGIEPFERTDLLTANDDTITMLGQRVLRVRSALAAPRIRSVSLDARTADNALDLMTTVEVYKPSRYRCRLLLDRGLVFDADHLATGVAHEMTPSRWSLNLNLDLAAPFAASGGHWDGAYWDQALWSAGA